MNLIDRYIAEVGKHLTLRNRADIQKEIHSTLQDMLEDQAGQAGREPDEAMLVKLLKEFGRPEDVAASYLPERQLIGPQLYPIFSLVCWVALPVLAAVLLIVTGIGVFTANLTPVALLKEIGQMLLQVGSALVSAFGSIVITFAILERVFGTKEIKTRVRVGKLEHMAGLTFQVEGEEKDWDPRDLPEVEDVEKFSIPGLVAEIVFTVIAILIFNFFPRIIGYGFLLNEHWTFLPLLSDTFFGYLPYLNGLWGLQIVLNLVLLRQGHWATTTRWLRFTLLVLGIILAAFMLAGPDLVASSAASISVAWPDLSSEAANILTLIPRILVKVALGLSILSSGVELLKILLHQVNRLNLPDKV
ncbi:MAG: hypothetical protein JXB85_14795 [Anaerolineales bacterium]|nr:hypothetical protein [Anaerolineales bacterium]